MVNEDISEGIILNADFGYGMKFNDKNNLYLKLEIQDFNGYPCIQLFSLDKIPSLLGQFKSEFCPVCSIQSLIHRKVFLLNINKIKATASAVSGLSLDDDDFEWVENDNWD